MTVELVVAAGNRLGECPLWCDRRNRLYWVDSRAPAVHWLDEDGSRGSVATKELVGSIAFLEAVDRPDGPGGREHRLLAAMESGFFLVDPDRDAVEPFIPVAVPPGHRFNDGRVDRAGRFWAGTMNDRERTPTGSLYRLGPDGAVAVVLGDVIVPNSLAWSPDSTTMYFADTYRHRIDAWRFDQAAGTLGGSRPFADLGGGPGRPDGSAVDADGCLWNCEYAGGRLVRYTPEGKVDRVVPMPVSNPTCCAFGGRTLDTLFVTSASQRLSAEQLAREPQAGSVFALRPGVSGLPESRWRGAVP